MDHRTDRTELESRTRTGSQALQTATAAASSLSWPAKGKLRQAFSDRLALSEGIEAVGRMLDAMPNGRAGVADSYIGNMAALFCQYPRVIALGCAHPTKGVVTKTSFIPTVAEVVQWCEALTADMHKSVVREDRIDQQLRERDEWERGPENPPRQTLEELRAEMRARGFPMGGKAPHTETAASVKAKYGLNDAQWAEIPDAPPAGHWEKLVDAYRPVGEPAG